MKLNFQWGQGFRAHFTSEHGKVTTALYDTAGDRIDARDVEPAALLQAAIGLVQVAFVAGGWPPQERGRYIAEAFDAELLLAKETKD